MEVISYRQSVFLLSMILPVTGHFLLLPVIFSLSERDSWISILLTIPIGLLFAFILFRLHKLHPDKTIVEMTELAFGTVGGKIITVSFLGYFAYMLVITLYGLLDFIRVIFLPETPQWALVLSFYLVILYGVYIGIESVTRMAEPLFLIIIFTGISIAIASYKFKNYGVLFPVFENGFSHTLHGIGLTTALFGEFILIMMIKMKKEHLRSKSFFFTLVITVIFITWMFVATVSSSLAIFGLEQVENMEYPAQGIVRLVSFGFIERFDIYGIFTIVLGCVIRMSTFQYVLNLAIRQWLKTNKKWVIHVIITIFVLSFALYGIGNHQEFVEVYLTKYYPVSAIISVILPFLIWIVLEIKHKWRKTSFKNL